MLRKTCYYALFPRYFDYFRLKCCVNWENKKNNKGKSAYCGEWRGGTSPLRSSSCAPHGAQPSQKPACRFPARASSAVDSQYGEGLHPCKRDVQPRTPQRKRFLNLLKFLPNYAAPLAATGKHLTPVALCKAVDPME